jgi:uncharacterized protein YndB with AHSA1/START domain
MTDAEKAAPAAPKELTLTRIINAPREKVYDAWTKPELFAVWWSPRDFTNDVRELNAVPGGQIDMDMIYKNGARNPMGGEFKELNRPEKLVFITTAFEDENGVPGIENLNTVTFEEDGGKTKLTLHVKVLRTSPAVEKALSGMSIGWNQSLDKLEEMFV